MTGFFDTFSDREANGARAMMRDLRSSPWAQPLMKAITDNGGLRGENMALFFELRFGHALCGAGIDPSYEIPGENGSTIDFGFGAGGYEFNVELMRFTETAAAIAATHERTDEDGIVWVERLLSTDAEDARQSDAGELLKAIQRICQKCERNGKPHKFLPGTGRINVLLVDMRTCLHGGDIHDLRHIALGACAVKPEYRSSWQDKPITGVFHPETTLRGADLARVRLHFIGFVHEKGYEPGDFAPATMFIANPHLFSSRPEARAVLATYPLQPADSTG